MNINLKRIYDVSAEADGTRILVDRLWPRGVSKDRANLDYWLKEIAPTHTLRKSFYNGELTFSQLKEQYLIELNSGEQNAALEKLKSIAEAEQQITLLFSAKSENENHAIILREILES